MKTALISVVLVLLTAAWKTDPARLSELKKGGDAAEAPSLLVPWTLTILNLQRQVVGQLTVRFTEDRARSCISGNWKRIVVLNYKRLGEPAFPGTDPLSYTLEGGTLTVGRNEVCDGYVMLKGEITAASFSGEYFTLGLGGTSHLGYVQGTPAN